MPRPIPTEPTFDQRGAVLVGACGTAAAHIIAGTGESPGSQSRGQHVADLAYEIYQAAITRFGIAPLPMRIRE